MTIATGHARPIQNRYFHGGPADVRLAPVYDPEPIRLAATYIPLTYPYCRPILSAQSQEEISMATEHTKVFVSNRSQAVRLPKAVALPDNVREVDVIALGDIRIITPSGRRWDDWFDGPGVSDDFMAEREQPEEQPREGL